MNATSHRDSKKTSDWFKAIFIVIVWGLLLFAFAAFMASLREEPTALTRGCEVISAMMEQQKSQIALNDVRVDEISSAIDLGPSLRSDLLILKRDYDHYCK